MVRPRSPEHNAALPVQLVEIEEELVAPVSAKADDVALVDHERHVRVCVCAKATILTIKLYNK